MPVPPSTGCANDIPGRHSRLPDFHSGRGLLKWAQLLHRHGAEFLLATGYPTRLGSTDYLAACTVPKIFIQSTHDEFAPRQEFERLYAAFAEPKRVVWIEAADHFFAGALEQVESAATEAVSRETAGSSRYEEPPTVP